MPRTRRVDASRGTPCVLGGTVGPSSVTERCGLPLVYAGMAGRGGSPPALDSPREQLRNDERRQSACVILSARVPKGKRDRDDTGCSDKMADRSQERQNPLIRPHFAFVE